MNGTAMNMIDCWQGSAGWYKARCGRVTASRVCDVAAKLKRKDGEAQARKDYKAELLCEILTGVPASHFVSPAMIWGTEQEPFARVAYELAHDVTVDECGFAIHPRIERFGASPDGLVGQDGLVEIKCPTTAKHVEYLMEGKIPEEYAAQMLAQMACTGREWCDFVSFDPRLPQNLRLFVCRFWRDNDLIAVMEKEVEQFLAEVDERIANLMASYPQ